MQQKSLRYLLAIEEARLLSPAARALGVSQSALSLYLQRLEESQGATLYDRREHRLTRAGELYCEGAKKILLLHQGAMEEIQNLSTQRALTLGVDICISSSSPRLVPDLLARFGAEYPDHPVQIRFLPDAELRELSRRGETDLALGYLQNDGRVSADQCAVMTEELLLVTAPHTAADADPSALLERHSYIAMFRGSNFRATCDAALFTRKLTPTVYVESDCYDQARALLDTGQYITIIPARAQWRFEGCGCFPLRPSATAVSGFYCKDTGGQAAHISYLMELARRWLCTAYAGDAHMAFKED